MREVKARVWDKEEKKMIYFYPLAPVEEFDCFKQLACQSINENQDGWIDTHTSKPQDNVIIMLYTGRKSEVGQEIYGSDIVRIIDTLFIIQWNDDLAGFTCVTLDGHDDEVMWQGIEEVVGNLYETPKLLGIGVK